ncbi:cytochrome c3 family protein [Sporomusa acidovorans]|uniref:Tetrahaem cytochrome domain-containing protein n=1 Tax=Sporomusa acidovorans (strain ATCC 49682 / DSM 3132 / Mol) TaxID=1123286 RepID=A0ABZ3J026_SPOA4|nr:cytochrome c3 family protein [Sporomusa acidovorans]OZC21336.1 fumarate reductase flavoprotein subunit precursor [Sporomusa acidovorans DSM 3132]SDE57017.1 Tetraheme cytochrome c subunit of nitrate or TMAO reductase [Sporomusa acidovorans]
MESESLKKKGFRERFLQKKILLILLVLVVVVGGGGYAAMEVASGNPAFCANCHNMQPYYDSWSNSNLLAKKHADAKVNCHDCHEPSFSQQAEEGFKYVTGDFEEPMQQQKFPKEMCLKCHDYEKVKAKTSSDKYNPHDSHNGEQECYTCHSMHRQSTVQCAQCHSAAWMKNLDGSWKKGK